jgi:hypothetical protein
MKVKTVQHSYSIKSSWSPMSAQVVGHRLIVCLMSLVVLAKLPAIDARSAFVACSTPLPISGHGGSTAPGGGIVRLSKDGTTLDCGSSIKAGAVLALTTQGTSGQSEAMHR